MPNVIPGLHSWIGNRWMNSDKNKIRCVDCDDLTHTAMCHACVEKMSEYILKHQPPNHVHPAEAESRLKLYEVVVYPHPAATAPCQTAHVLLLASGPASAEKEALDHLRMADPGGRIKMSTREITGPFRDGYILHAGES